MLGNACEVALRIGPETLEVSLRGSSWHEGVRDARATATMSWDGSRKPSIGFRPVISVLPVPE